MSIPRALYRDLDFHDRANDAHVSAMFGDDYEYGIPPSHRRGYRPSLSSAIGHAISHAAAPGTRHSSSHAGLPGTLSTKEPS